MKKSWKRTEVTTETETLLVFRRGANTLRAWCEGCGAETLLITPGTAASLAGVTTDVIYERIDAGLIHSTKLPDGALLVCGASVGLNQT